MTLQDRAHRIFAVLALIFVPFVAWSRDITVIVLVLSTMAVLCDPVARQALAVHAFVRNRGAQVGFAVLVWATAAVFWAPHNAWSAWAKAIVLVVLTVMLVVGLEALPSERLRRFAPWVAAAAGGLFFLLMVERATGGFFIHIERSTSASDTLYNVLSGGLTLLCCLAFCAAYFLWQKFSRRGMAIGFVAGCFVLSLFYRMDAAPVALGVGAVGFLLIRRLGRPMFAFLGIWLVVITLAWGSVASLAWNMNAPVWLDDHGLRNWASRILIWHGVAQLIADNSIVGYGFDSSRIVGQGRVSFLHPHNGVLQVWLELGMVGVLLMYASAARAARVLVQNARDTTVMAVAAATVVTFSVFWSLSFGIWQGWYLAVAGITVAALVLLYKTSQSAE